MKNEEDFNTYSVQRPILHNQVSFSYMKKHYTEAEYDNSYDAKQNMDNSP